MVLDTTGTSCYYRHTNLPSTKPKFIKVTIYSVVENLAGTLRVYGKGEERQATIKDPHDDCWNRQTDLDSDESIAAQVQDMVEDLPGEGGRNKYEFNPVDGVSAEEMDRNDRKRTFWHIETIGQAIQARATDPKDRP
jgi:hypothetical protein